MYLAALREDADENGQPQVVKDGKRIVFTSHTMLDAYVLSLPEYQEHQQGIVDKDKQAFKNADYSLNGELSLLKAFDRGFWLRYKKNPANQSCAPAIACPFGNDVTGFIASVPVNNNKQ